MDECVEASVAATPARVELRLASQLPSKWPLLSLLPLLLLLLRMVPHQSIHLSCSWAKAEAEAQAKVATTTPTAPDIRCPYSNPTNASDGHTREPRIHLSISASIHPSISMPAIWCAGNPRYRYIECKHNELAWHWKLTLHFSLARSPALPPLLAPRNSRVPTRLPIRPTQLASDGLIFDRCDQQSVLIANRQQQLVALSIAIAGLPRRHRSGRRRLVVLLLVFLVARDHELAMNLVRLVDPWARLTISLASSLYAHRERDRFPELAGLIAYRLA